MRVTMRKFVWQLLSVMALLLFALVPHTDAATPGGNGLRISPVRTEVTINPGQTQTVNVTVTNITNQSASLQTIINDFTANPDESGNPAIILDPNQFATSHSLKRYATAGGDFVLQPGQQKAVPIKVTIPKDAIAGGYFGAVRFAPTSNTTTGNQNVSLAGSVGSLVLVKVPGDIKEQMSIASFDIRRGNRSSTLFTTNKGLSALVRFQNEGNIQEAPFGKILLKDSKNKILASYEVNNTNPPGNVLPNSIRKFPINIDKVGSFGKYKLEGNFGYGAAGQLLTASTTFYVVPLSLLILGAVLLALIILAIFVLPRIIRAYNRSVVRKASRRR